MLACLVWLLVYVILAAIAWYVVQEVLAVFWTPPAQVLHLVGILLGLLVLIAALDCLGVLGDGGHSFMHRVP